MRVRKEEGRLIGQDVVQDMGFGVRHVILSLYECLKHDGRTSRGKLSRKMVQRRLMTASDDDLADLATYEFRVCTGRWTCQEILDRLIKKREELRAGHYDGESVIH